MKIFITRNNERHGPYSLEDVNAYLVTGQLLAHDMAWYEGIEGWIALSDVPGVNIPQRLPPPPPIAPARQATPQNTAKDERSSGLELMGCLFPILGLIFWAVYANSQPERAKNIGIYSLIGFGVGIMLWLFIAAVGNA